MAFGQGCAFPFLFPTTVFNSFLKQCNLRRETCTEQGSYGESFTCTYKARCDICHCRLQLRILKFVNCVNFKSEIETVCPLLQFWNTEQDLAIFLGV